MLGGRMIMGNEGSEGKKLRGRPFLPCFSIVLSVYDSTRSNHMETWNRLPKMALLYYGDSFLQHFCRTYPNLVPSRFL